MEVVVIGAGQAGLSAGRFLQHAGYSAEELVLLDHNPRPGGAWQHRWASLTLGVANHVHDLPDLRLESTQDQVPAEGAFTPELGRDAVGMVEERVRAGLPPGSIVSVTGLLLTPVLREARERGVLVRRPMFARLVPEGVEWADGERLAADVILWCAGFRSALDHLAPLGLRGPGGGIAMTGRLATQVAADPRVHLLGYGPSASTIGANRAGRAAVAEVGALLGNGRDPPRHERGACVRR